MKFHQSARMVLSLGVVCLGLSAVARDLYFSIDDDPNKYWDYAPGWKTGSGTVVGSLPTADDDTTFNSMYLDVKAGKTPLAITNGVQAVARTCWLGTLEQTDRRVIGLKVDGGSLNVRKTNDWNCLTVGHNQNCYGLLDIAGGRVSAKYMLIGREGSGVVTNRGGFVCLTNWNARMIIGSTATGNGRYVQTGGYTGGHDEGQVDNTAVVAGHYGHGVIELQDGVISNRVALGSERGGVGEMFVSGGTMVRWIDVGAHWAATGRLVVTGGRLEHVTYVGRNGYGVATFDAPGFLMNDLRIGCTESGMGIVTNLQSIAADWPGRTVYAGIWGEGHLHAKANVTMPYMKISASTNFTSTMTVYAGATNFVGVQVNIGGSVFPAAMRSGETGNFEVPGHGVYILKGGAIKFTTVTTDVNLYLGRTAPTFPGTWGILRGYGDVLPASDGATNIRMSIGEGQVIADGEGVERVLNLNAVVNVTNTVPTGPTGTNGWYAVNKGCVLFPRTWYGTGTTITRSFGDAPYAPQPGLVNSLTFTINQPSQGMNYFRGGVYAADRADIPVGTLPPNNGVVSCWKLGTFGSLSGTDKRAYNTISLTFRYDAAKAPTARRFSLWRHNGTAWTRVGRAVREEGVIPRISATGLTPVAQTFNVGVFAVTADKAGLTILIR